MFNFPRRVVPSLLAGACLLSLGACSREVAAPLNEVTANDAGAAPAVAPGTDAATAQTFNFADGEGKSLGNVALSEGADGLTITVNASGLPAGTHGIHLHEKGLCEGPKFASAGAHWNPETKEHGRDNPQGAHLGDLPNLEVDSAGKATTSFSVASVVLANGANKIGDTDGTALVVHAKADDYKTDPTGDSGDRIACAVLAAPK